MNLTPRTLLLTTLLTITLPGHAADLLVTLVNSRILDSHGKLRRPQTLLVDQDKVVASGNDVALAGREDNAKVIDSHGRTLLPDVIDDHGHVHVWERGHARNSVRVRVAATAQASEPSIDVC